MKAILIILGVAGLLGAIWFFTKSSTDSKTTDTKTNTTTNSGLSGLLAGLNLSGLSLGLV